MLCWFHPKHWKACNMMSSKFDRVPNDPGDTYFDMVKFFAQTPEAKASLEE